MRAWHLYPDHLYVEDTLEHQRMWDLRNNNYRPEYVKTCVVPSESSDHAYLTSKIRCLDTPYSRELDVIEHRVETCLCSCDDFFYNRSMGVESGDITPSDMGSCKHCVMAFGVDIE